ncbi:hypothetical protein BDR26DRAFT_1011700 [Obelidium mucronatum]|nr:hypothetical protein BDR26DRAFT_1011700 [Obelidium mucronatum]
MRMHSSNAYCFLHCSLLILLVVHSSAQVPTIRAGGSSFTEAPFAAALSDFSNIYPGVQAHPYDENSSVLGQRNVASGVYNWGGSDLEIDSSLYNGTNAIVGLPAVVGGLVITLNLPGNQIPVKLARDVLPRIFDGTIKFWNHSMLLRDNPMLAAYNTGANRVKVVQLHPESGTSMDLVYYLGLLDVSTGFKNSPFRLANYRLNVSGSITAKSTMAAGIMVGGFPYTITYLNAFEALEQSSSSGVTRALLQHKDGSFVGWSMESVAIAAQTFETVYKSPRYNSTDTINLYDTETKGAYPLTVVSKFVIRPYNISASLDTTIATLKFLWWFIQSPQYSAGFQFTPIFNTSLGAKTLNHLKTISFDGKIPLYGQSVCDIDIDGTYRSPCVHGFCSDPLPFQYASAECICQFGYENIHKTDCSEPTPVFITGPATTAQISMFIAGLLVVLVSFWKVYQNRGMPEMKAISPLCCLFILGGCFIGVLGILVDALSISKDVCNAKYVVPVLAFGMVYSMIFFKSLRIFLIFGYSKIARSRFLKDDVMIGASLIVGILDAVFALWTVGIKKTEPVTCFLHGYVDIAVGLKASAKFDESRKNGAVIILSTLLIGLNFAVLFGIPGETKTLYQLRRVFSSTTTFLLCTLSPVILFAPAFGLGASPSGTGLSHGYDTSDAKSSQNDLNDGLVKTYMFHTGLKLNRPAALWKSAVIMVMTELDMLIILSEGNNGTYTLSKSNIMIQEKTTKAAKAAPEECLEITLGANKICHVLEFPNREKMEEFRSLRGAAGIKKKGGAGGGGGVASDPSRLSQQNLVATGAASTLYSINRESQQIGSQRNLAALAVSLRNLSQSN